MQFYFSTRNKERLALIEKGVNASVFMKGQSKNTAPFWKVLILNVSLLFIGIGLGVFLALTLKAYTPFGDEIYPASIFLMASIGLIIGFTLAKKLDKE